MGNRETLDALFAADQEAIEVAGHTLLLRTPSWGDVTEMATGAGLDDQGDGGEDMTPEEERERARLIARLAERSVAACIDGCEGPQEAGRLIGIAGGLRSPLVRRCMALCGMAPIEEEGDPGN